MSGFSLSRLFLSFWASLNSRLYKETHRLEAVAKYLPSFTFVIVTEMEGEFFNVFFFNRRTCSRRRLLFGLRGIPFDPLAVVWINDTKFGINNPFSPSFKINNAPTRTSSDIYAIKKKKFSFSTFSLPCYTTDEQIFSTHFDFRVMVQYKGEANVFLNPKPSLNFL